MRFGSKKVTDENGVIWDSTTEYKYGLKLKELQEKGVIKDLQRQVEHVLIPSFKDGQGNSIRKMSYISDFEYIDVATGKYVILDVKGSAFNIDPVFSNKFKLLKYNLREEKNIQYKIMIKYKDVWYDLEDKEQKRTYRNLHAEAKKNKAEKKAKKSKRNKVIKK